MRELDLASKVFFSQNDVFASFFNTLVFQERHRLQRDSLVDCPTEQLLPLLEKSGGRGPFRTAFLKRMRDLLKLACIKQGADCICMLLGMELQSHTDYTMPLRVMLYDAMVLTQEVRKIAAANRSGNPPEAGGSGEFLSGFRRTDRITPVVTVVVNLNDDPWDGPTRLSEMYDIPKGSEDLLKFFPEYAVHVVSLNRIEYDKLKKLDNRIEFISNCINVRNDKEKCRELWDSFWERNEITIETWTLAKNLLGRNIIGKKEADMYNPEVYPYVKENIKKKYYSEARAEGRAEGLAEGKAAGLAEGKAKGLAEGKAKGLAEGKAAGLAEGKAKGKAEGLAEGRAEERRNMVMEIGSTLFRQGVSPKEAIAQICAMLPSFSCKTIAALLAPIFG